MKKYRALLGICFVFLFLLAGCARYKLVNSGNAVDIGKTYRVNPLIDWSMYTENDVTSWTVDGPLLEKVSFFPGIENGKPLLKAADDKKMPVFSSTMTPIEVMDLVEATLARQKALSVKKENLKPALFGRINGFRFNFSYVSEDGLEYRGFATGTIKDNKLYLIMYTGTALFYYDKYVEQVERIVSAIEII